MYPFTIIVAICEKTRGIGYQGSIPWKSKEDMAFFRKTTTMIPSEEYTNVVIMGKNTFISLGSRPLKGRLNVVCSRTMKVEDETNSNNNNNNNIIVASSLDEALEKISQYKKQKINKVFLIGGEQLYKEGIHHQYCNELYINCLKLPEMLPFDTFFPEIDNDVYKRDYVTENTSNNDMDITYTKYSRI